MGGDAAVGGFGVNAPTPAEGDAANVGMAAAS